jgi:hypothetical protein
VRSLTIHYFEILRRGTDEEEYHEKQQDLWDLKSAAI